MRWKKQKTLITISENRYTFSNINDEKGDDRFHPTITHRHIRSTYRTALHTELTLPASQFHKPLPLPYQMTSQILYLRKQSTSNY